MCTTVDGEWSSWGSWSECTSTCGSGSRTRLRTCTNPTPERGGKTCTGKATELSMCNKDTCPGILTFLNKTKLFTHYKAGFGIFLIRTVITRRCVIYMS